MNPEDLINKRVLNKQNRMQGIIKSVNGTTVTVDNGPFGKVKYPYPSAFSDTLILEDDDLQEQLRSVSTTASFGKFKQIYRREIEKEIDYVRSTGGKKYRKIGARPHEIIINSIAQNLLIFNGVRYQIRAGWNFMMSTFPILIMKLLKKNTSAFPSRAEEN